MINPSNTHVVPIAEGHLRIRLLLIFIELLELFDILVRDNFLMWFHFVQVLGRGDQRIL